ncbi:MAG: hypothetical protein Ct9H300mP11_04250 [Chloroflexota bacterium]|jgi:mono/diheme cytochrome c family protein|nr:MAG: cytochrome c [SAR202 cluster bacterium]PKB60751.1 MAG: hypothetical protein BZY64_00195 [SAR202 cluster bacterium Ae2-Chloro-G1]GIT42489.1 MAG: hypothetical protein Ct9H300mP11_04250 [Chloroflexota bacterium]
MINRAISHFEWSSKDEITTRRNMRGLRRWFVGVAMLFGIILVGCSQGSYPVDIFYEQHYQQSYRSHEPPRLDGVAGAVAFYPSAASVVTDTGADLYKVNCQMCHGSDAKGNGPVLSTITNDYGYEPIVPTDITNRPIAFIASRLEATTRPLGPTSVMPPFGKLLSQEERVAIAEFVGSLPK